MKFYITLLCLITSAASKASQVGFTLADSKEMQEKAAQFIFQLIADKNHRVLKNLLQCHPEIINEMPRVTIEEREIEDEGAEWALSHRHILLKPDFVFLTRQNTITIDGNSALHYAITIHNHDALRMLLFEYGANPDLANKAGYTVFMQAADALCSQSMQALIEAGADTEVQSPDKKTAVDFAKERAAARKLSLRDYNAEMKKYYQAIADGKAKRALFLEEITDIIGIKDLAAIICEYTYYGSFSRDLPKSDEKKSWFQPHCTIQ